MNDAPEKSRRKFLETLVLGPPAFALAHALPTGLARAATRGAPERAFVFAYFGGGWDTLMSFDPRDPAVFTPDRRATTGIDPAYERLRAPYAGRGYQRALGTPFSFGPAIGELGRHTDVLAVVNGISMDTLIHDLARRCFIPVGRPFSGRLDLQHATSPAMRAVRDRYGLSSDFAGPEASAAIAGQVVKRGLSRCVSIQLADALDTHDGDWQDTHADDLARGLTALARLIVDLKASPHPAGGSHLDHTTILAFSEFGRSPLVNAMGGRDHHAGNSALLIGAGIKGGQVFGRSSDFGMLPLPVDPRSGAPDPGGVIITPAHVHATVLAAAGLDHGHLGVGPLSGLLRG